MKQTTKLYLASEGELLEKVLNFLEIPFTKEEDKDGFTYGVYTYNCKAEETAIINYYFKLKNKF